MGKIIAICNQKGGTGKTTSAINLSAYIALIGKKVLLIDLDPQGNATSGLGIDKYKIEKSTYHILLDEAEINQIILPTEIENLKLLPANIDLTGAEVELVGVLGRENALKRKILPIKEEFDFIFIDSPPSLGLLTINALCAAESVLIPVQCEYYALEGLTQLLKTINLVKMNLNPQLVIEGVFLTMADFRTRLTQEVIKEVRSFFSTHFSPAEGLNEKVFQTVIPRNIRLSEAPGFGKPIALYDNYSLGAQRYLELSRELLGLPLTEEKQGESNGEEKSGSRN
ncbi:MAG: AAA family ATPase [Candidatus Omnitrophica bacterium]|nr:AAA family ATPase [Candidatus Omnitrophota bacterium]